MVNRSAFVFVCGLIGFLLGCSKNTSPPPKRSTHSSKATPSKVATVNSNSSLNGPTKPVPPNEEEVTAIAKTQEWSVKVCQCETLPCAKAASNEFKAWATRHQKRQFSKVGKSTIKRATESAISCVKKLAAQAVPVPDPSEGKSGDSPFIEAVIAKFEAAADATCRCKEIRCANRVAKNFGRWSEKNVTDKVSKHPKVKAAAQRAQDCFNQLTTASLDKKPTTESSVGLGSNGAAQGNHLRFIGHWRVDAKRVFELDAQAKKAIEENPKTEAVLTQMMAKMIFKVTETTFAAEMGEKSEVLTYTVKQDKGDSLILVGKVEGSDALETVSVTFSGNDYAFLSKDNGSEKLPLVRSR